MNTTGPAAYVQVTTALRKLALDEPWTTAGLLPAEPALMEKFQVSRGTLRRATDALVREGLLRPDRGRGTYVRRQAQLRALIKESVAAIAIPDSRSHLDVLRFVPDFAGSELTHDRVVEMDAYRDAQVVFIAPDNSLRGLIQRALHDGKLVVVPTYAMRRGMVLLDPARVPAEHREFAATLDGLERFGHSLSLDELRALERINLFVTGAVALTRSGVHIGSGDAYLDIEWGILSVLGLVDVSTPIVGIVHPVQLVDAQLLPTPLDITIDIIITTDETITASLHYPRPTGIAWAQLDEGRLQSIAYLRELAALTDQFSTERNPRPS
ncbi:MAG: 5-formyltetrahydrofolate cyclo-ligase [Glaciihabitans sp.]|nr:5-formyltetrahydrofolate cyclo-ligase [Glaciihabitans sp.]